MTAALILAAGKGTRMGSDLPKPLVELNGQPIVSYIVDAFLKTGIHDIHMVVGHGAKKVMKAIGPQISYVHQTEQKGTAHAVMMSEDNIFEDHDHVFVFVGDSPLISAKSIKALYKHHIQTKASCTFLTSKFPFGLPYARVVRGENQRLLKCVEEKNASTSELLINELLSSHFIFKVEDLYAYLEDIKPDKDNGELYLTDIINIFIQHHLPVETVFIENYAELVGLNTPEDLKWAESMLQNALIKNK